MKRNVCISETGDNSRTERLPHEGCYSVCLQQVLKCLNNEEEKGRLVACMGS
jgi:hypothetical protein